PAAAPPGAHPLLDPAPAERALAGVAPRGEFAGTVRAAQLPCKELGLDRVGVTCQPQGTTPLPAAWDHLDGS
ncbi:MAG TPA: hypothetical protein VMD59_04100, partial [Acidimicrobiales bacterium]|nr:hypothetical protein [Acidimicrobiales bacterium]